MVVTEGYMDVIALARAGFPSVAPLGTALTEAQMTEAWRLAPEPILCFDGDAAGRRAAVHAVERILPLLKPGLSVHFALLPEGRDPDDLVRTEGTSALAAVLAHAVPLFEITWQMVREGRTLDTPERRAALEQAINAVTERIADPTIRRNYRALLHERNRTLFQKARDKRKPPGYAPLDRRLPPAGPPFAPRLAELAGRVFVAFLLAHPQILFHHAEQAVEALAGDKALSALIESALVMLANHPDMDGARLAEALEHAGEETLRATLGRHLASELQRQCPDPETDYRRMLSVLRDQALAHESEAVQTIIARELSPEAWQYFQSLQEERCRLQAETD
ncbi:MAG: DNA primase [Rhodospirillaceae bacterium]|nr:MAG: DNA primase [Rhodospirillaceae bacterium]